MKRKYNITPTVEGLIDFIKRDYNGWAGQTPYGNDRPEREFPVEVDAGSKYLKVVTQRNKHGFGGSCWGFIDRKTGDIYKAASWRAPAKHARGNLNDINTWKDFKWTGPQYLL